MQQQPSIDIVAIGGSAGSLPVLVELLEQLPRPLACAVVIIVHRLKNVPSDLDKLLSVKNEIKEPEDKEPVLPERIYLAPQNYHLLVETDHTFSLDYSEPLHFSRPSIDISFASIAEAYGAKATGILLSGANKDGAEGLHSIVAAGGCGIAQDPDSALFDTMPQAAMDISPEVRRMTVKEMIHYLKQLKKSA